MYVLVAIFGNFGDLKDKKQTKLFRRKDKVNREVKKQFTTLEDRERKEYDDPQSDLYEPGVEDVPEEEIPF